MALEASLERQRETRILGRQVIAVATQGGAGHDWAAYIGAVPGINYDEEVELVLSHGDKLPYSLAKFLFPKMARKYSWRP